MKIPFIPHNLPIQDLDLSKLIKLVSEANSNLSRYNGALSHLINPSLLLATFATKEAVLSSRIEGTQASLEDVLQKDSKKHDESKILDIEEIENCKKALEYGAEDLKNRPLCLNLIKDMHSILLNGVRGHNKDRGNFRKIQNFIGFMGATIEQASYIPPSPDKMVIALDNWEKYIHLESEEILIQLAVIHAQFEIIHPFLDGNGRIGRILIPLFLYAKNYLNFPAFYMSEYLELHRSEYYDRLQKIRHKNDWQGWIEFFLRGIIEQSKISYNRVQRVVLLHKNIQNVLPKITQSKYLPEIINIIFEKPILTADDIIQKIPTIDNPAVLRILNKLSEPIEYELRRNVESNLFETKAWLSIEKSNNEYCILKKTQGSGKKPSSYEFVELLNIIEPKVGGSQNRF